MKGAKDQELIQDGANEARRVANNFANVSAEGLKYLSANGGLQALSTLFHHVVAILHTPSFAEENAAALRQDWPRVPLPAERERLIASAALGKQITALLDTESAVPGVTSGTIRPELKVIAAASRVGGGQLDAGAGHFDVTARWGISGKRGVTMPSTCRLTERDYTREERAALAKGATALKLDESTLLACLGDSTCDVFLNDTAYWRNVPAKVWAYTLGGYQVIKKWLSYREKALLGRALTIDEVTEVTHVARPIAALLLMQPALDANYRAVKEAVYPWPQHLNATR